MKTIKFTFLAYLTLLSSHIVSGQFYGQVECGCLNNQSNANDGQFIERIYIYSEPGETWKVTEATGLYDIDSPPPPLEPTPIPKDDEFYIGFLGRYTYEGIRKNGEPWSITVSNGKVENQLTNYHSCEYAVLDIKIPEYLCVNEILDINFTSSRGPIEDISWNVNMGQILNSPNGDTIQYQAPRDTLSKLNLQLSANAVSNDYGVGFPCYVTTEKEVNIINDEEICAAVLPVRYQYFRARNSSGITHLVWETSFEVNNWGWEIERSEDGREWVNVGNLESNDNDSRYIYEDKYDGKESVLYYRLKQVDFDGRFSYSVTKKVVINSLSERIILYPNPNSGQFSIDTEEDILSIQATNQSGKSVFIEKIGGQNYQIDERGIFIISIKTNRNVTHQKLIIR